MSEVKVLCRARFRVVGMMEKQRCPAEEFMTHGETSTKAARLGLFDLLERIAEDGLQDLSVSLCHQVNKSPPIYELIKGPLRMLFFKGKSGDIAVCTVGVRKKGQKVDPLAVTKSIAMHQAYMSNPSQIIYLE